MEQSKHEGPAMITRLKFVVTCASPPASSCPRVTSRSHSKVPEGSATCPRSHCQPRAQPGCLSPGQAAPGPCPPPKLPLSLPAAHRRGSCWILGLHAPLPLSALSFLFRPSAPGPRNPSLDWGRTPCPGAAGRSSRSGALVGEALLTRRQSPCAPRVPGPTAAIGLCFHFTQNLPRGRWV